MVQSVGNEAINKAVIKIHNMSADDRMRERAWMRDMALHDEASAMLGAKREGHAEGLAEGLFKGRSEGLAEGLFKGRSEGLAEGRAEGQNQLAFLISKLFSIGRSNEVEKVAVDPIYRQKLMTEFGI